MAAPENNWTNWVIKQRSLNKFSMMICLIRRYHVTNVMAFLIVTMIMVNLYALAVVIGGKATSEGNNIFKESRKSSDDVILVQNISTIRFIRFKDGSVRLFSPMSLNSQQMQSIASSISRRFHEMQMSNRRAVQGYGRVVARIKRALSVSNLNAKSDPSSFWAQVAGWPFHVDNYQFQSMGEMLRFSRIADIIQAKNSKRGTQLKIEVVLEGGQVALFKPKWYPSEVEINGKVYSGKDRHFGEIASFYLNQILGYNCAPITVGRRVNLFKEIFSLATDQLKETFLRDKANNLCVYGVCFYCKKEDFVCAEGDFIDGALILLLNKKLRIVANPWRRTYKEKSFAAWETNSSFCSTVFKESDRAKRQEVLLDIVAVAVFDFLIGNGDRHHFEMYANVNDQPSSKSHSKSILLIDNGKSFGNSNEDYLDILAPLYQCCKIRRSLWRTLNKFRGVLGKSLDSVSSFDTLYPLLTKDHLGALDRRLLIVLSTVQACLDRFTEDYVIV